MKIKYVQTILTDEEEKALKKKAKTSTKDALRTAVEHYLACKNV
jgi:hypothetical protein